MPTDDKISQLPTGTVIFGNDIFPFSHGITGAVTPETQQASLILLANTLRTLGYYPTGSNAQLNGLYQPSGTAGMELIYGDTLLASTGSIIIPAIPQSFRNLEIFVEAKTTHSAADGVKLKFNNDGGTNYNSYIVWHNFDSGSNDETHVGEAPAVFAYANGSDAPANVFAFYTVWIYGYRQGRRKNFQSRGGQFVATGSASQFFYDAMGNYNSLSAVNRIDLIPSNGSFVSGTTYALYGLK